MNKIREKIYDIFKWDLNDFFKAILGICLFSFAINIFIVPNDLYSGRVLGFAQVLRSLILMIFDFENQLVKEDYSNGIFEFRAVLDRGEN